MRISQPRPPAKKMSANSEAEGVKIEGGEGTGKSLPLIIRALEGKDSLDYLNGWIASNKSWLQAKMVLHGELAADVP